MKEAKTNNKDNIILAVDSINIHPSIKLSKIKKLVRFFASKLTAATKAYGNMLYAQL